MTGSPNPRHDGYDGYDAFASAYDRFMDHSPWYRNLRQTEASLLRAVLAEVGSGTLLDLGCGTGFAARIAVERGFGVWGVDPSPEMLAGAEHHLRNAPDVVLLEAQAERLDRLGPDFDVIVALGSVLNHTDDADGLMRSISVNSRPGTHLLLTTDNLLGLDAFSWAAYLAAEARLSGTRELWRRFRARAARRPYLGDCTFHTPTGEMTVALRYDPPSEVLGRLRAIGFRPREIRGANCFASLSRRTVKSSVGLPAGGRGRIGAALARLDRRLARRIWPMSGAYVVWAERA